MGDSNALMGPPGQAGWCRRNCEGWLLPRGAACACQCIDLVWSQSARNAMTSALVFHTTVLGCKSASASLNTRTQQLEHLMKRPPIAFGGHRVQPDRYE